MTLVAILLLLLVLAPLAAWGAMVWSKRRIGLAAVFMVVAIEAAILGVLRFWFI